MLDITILLKNFYNISHIPTALYARKRLMASYSPVPIVSKLAYRYVAPFLYQDNQMDVIVSPNFLICGFLKVKTSDQVVVLGPVVEFRLDRNMVQQTLAAVHETTIPLEDLLTYFDSTPYTSWGTLVNHLAFLYPAINQEQPTRISLNQPFSTMVRSTSEAENHNRLNPTQPYELERRLLSCVEFGKTANLIHILKDEMYIEQTMGVMSNASLRTIKNIFIVSVTLASRAAVKGGMDYEKALEAADRYLQINETQKDITSVLTLWAQMLIDFTEHAEKCHQLEVNSRLVHEVCHYVYDHLYGKIQVSDIAAALGYNRSYLCRRFKQDTQKTVGEFIAHVKIDEAKRLLLATDKSLYDIASDLGFSSQSYFQTVFNKVTNVSPALYKRGMREI